MTSPATPQSLREYVRGHASEFLVDPNITSVGVGHKVVDGRRIDEVCVQFTVRQKVDLADLETLGSAPIPESVEVREHPVLRAGCHHLGLDVRGRPGGHGVRSGGPCHQPGLTLGGVPGDLGRHGLARDSHRRSDVGLFPPCLVPLDDQPPAVNSQTGTTVGHENLRWLWTLDKPHPSRRFSHDQAQPTVTNLLAENN